MRKKEESDIQYFKKYEPSYNTSEIINSYFYMKTANSLWPAENFAINSNYVSTIENSYNGKKLFIYFYQGK